MKTPDELTGLFRERGLKVTPQRQCIFRALHETRLHPTAESVYDEVRQEMPTISLRTVYQTLNDLAAMGELLHLDLGTGSARFDPNVEAIHHHLVCESCGLVRDVHAEVGPLDPDSLPDGFTVSGAELVVRGRCAACSAAPVAEAAREQPATP